MAEWHKEPNIYRIHIIKVPKSERIKINDGVGQLNFIDTILGNLSFDLIMYN